jgi:two-component system nitrogen regulation response regulator NtrX
MNEELKQAKTSFEKIYIEHQLRKFSGNVTKTADFIGINRSALHRKLNTLNTNSKQDKN